MRMLLGIGAIVFLSILIILNTPAQFVISVKSPLNYLLYRECNSQYSFFCIRTVNENACRCTNCKKTNNYF